jgi:hypothetical protein
MSDAFYNGMRDSVAGPLLEKYGMPLTLVRVTAGTYDPNTGGITGATTASYACFGLVDEFKAGEVIGAMIRSGDKKLLLSAKNLTVVPQIGDQFTMPDGTWYIPEGSGSGYNPIQTLAPGGVAVMYTLQVRR